MRISDWSSDVCSSDLPSELLKAQDASIGVSRGGSLVRKPTASYEKMLEDLLVEGFDLAAHEQMMVELALRKAGGNLAEAAKTMNMRPEDRSGGEWGVQTCTFRGSPGH